MLLARGHHESSRLMGFLRSKAGASLATAIILVLALRAVLAGHALLSGDEAYYWLWSRRLQLSYFDHPAMMAWWMAASTWAFGTSELTIRLPALFATTLASLLVFDTARLAFADVRAGLWAAVWLNVTILFAAAAVTVTPDSPLLAFWAVALWALVRLLAEGRGRWLYVLGAAMGLGFLGKYTMVLIAPGVLAVFVLFPQGRRWLTSRHFYLAIALAAACTAPVLVWNLMNDWVSFRKQIAHSFSTPVHDPLKSLGTFLATQVGVMTPLILALTLWGMGWALWAGWRRNRPEWFLLGATSAPVLAFFIHHSLDGLVQPHWPGPAYLGGVMAALGCWSQGRDGMGRGLRWLYRAAPALGAVMVAIVYLQMGSALLPLPPKADALSRLGGWDQLAGRVAARRAEHSGAFVYVQKHELSGLLTYYLPGRPVVFLTGSNGAPRIPSYDGADVARLVGRDGFFVTKTGTSGVDDIAHYFDRVTLVETVGRSWGGRVIDTYEIWLTEGYRTGTFGENESEGESR